MQMLVLRKRAPFLWVLSLLFCNACASMLGDISSAAPARSGSASRGRNFSEAHSRTDEIEKTAFPTLSGLASGKEQPLEPDELSEVLRDSGERWFYGDGIGKTMMNVGAIAIWPPYAIYVVGNAAISMAGYEPVHITSALPEPAREEVLSVYDSVTAVPGKINSAIAKELSEDGAE
ncbi:MAG: hypothetical protein IT291_01975 [Deltaproteobacteria bacterium]|nr:hypothetical protein [Deltaproteobacteria bacterium]